MKFREFGILTIDEKNTITIRYRKEKKKNGVTEKKKEKKKKKKVSKVIYTG